MNEIWPGWETVRLIGHGSFGTVYEIQRKLNDHIEKSALKVISLPKDTSEIDAMYRDGYDEQSITLTFKSHRNSIIDEYSFSRQVSSANIVYCEDFRDIQRDDGIGWDIYIKMELLTTLAEALPERITEGVVIKLGMDICKALVVCQKHNVIHRDIKPQNIFVSDNGEYKLGDFGIAKIAEKATSGTMTGTYKYMAPEVYNNQPYGSAADIYSLGLVLYWLLNERRMPFTPLPPAPLTNDLDDEARNRRLSGEAIPAPKNGSKTLKDIVLKACTYKQEDRYSSAKEMLDDLQKLDPDYVNEFVFKTSSDKNEDDSHRDTSVDERTISVFHTHEYSTEWTTDSETHWRECECGDKIDIGGHTFDDWVIVKPATEMSTGVQERTCVCCGHKETQTIPVLQHTHSYSSDWLSDTSSHWKVCSCGEKANVSSHTYGSWKTVKTATSTEAGERTRTCSICGYAETQKIAPTPAPGPVPDGPTKKEDEPPKKPKSKKKLVITVCAILAVLPVLFIILIVLVILLLRGCDSSNGNSNTENSRHEIIIPGDISCDDWYDSSDESSKENEHVHSYSSEWIANVAVHWHQCECGEMTDKAYHEYGEWVITTAATETTIGMQERSCSYCGYKETEVIPVLEHTHAFSTGWVSNSSSHWNACTCGEKANVSSHTFGSWKTVKTATCTKSGEKKRTCSACSYAETQTVSPTSHSYSQGACAYCGKLQSEGLSIGIETVSGKKVAIVYSVGTCKDSNIYIPAKYNGVAVTTIGHAAFRKCTFIKSITIPSSVTTIEVNAFTGCTGLTSVTFVGGGKWYITTTEGATSGQNISISNAQQAAQYVRNYQNYYWYKK